MFLGCGVWVIGVWCLTVWFFFFFWGWGVDGRLWVAGGGGGVKCV